MIYHQEHNSRGNYNYNAFTYVDTSYRPHVHKNFELIYVLDGCLELTVNGVSEKIEKGDVGLVLSMQVHAFEPKPHAKICVIVFAEQYVPYFAGRMENSEGESAVFSLSRETDALVRRYLIDGDSSVMMKKACFYALLDEYISKIRTVPKKAKNDELVCRIFEYVRENSRDDITLRSIAERFGYEYHYLSRLLNDGYRIKFSSLLNETRLEHALRLLGEGKMSVTEVAIETGFKSIRSFNYNFKKYIGCVPSEFQKKK